MTQRMVHPFAAKIRKSAGCPDVIWETVYPALYDYAMLLPDWLHELHVCWNDDDTNAALQIYVHPEYRRADFQVLPNFLTQPERQRHNILHELTHLYTAPQREMLLQQIEITLGDNPPAKRVALEQMRYVNESATVDLTAAFERLLVMAGERI